MSLSTPEITDRFSLPHRLTLAAALTDESFALTHAKPGRSLPYYASMYATCWLAWVVGTELGLLIGSRIPTQWVTFALPALFISLAVDSLRHYPIRRAAALVAGGTGTLLLTRLTGPLEIPLTTGFVLLAFHVLAPPKRETNE